MSRRSHRTRNVILIVVGLAVTWFVLETSRQASNQPPAPTAAPAPPQQATAIPPTALLPAKPTSVPPPSKPTVDADRLAAACGVSTIGKDPGNIKVWSPDHQRYLINEKDQSGVYQLFWGTADSPEVECVTCSDIPDGPKASQNKLQFHWSPDGEWITVGVEFEKHPVPMLPAAFIESLLLDGNWLDIYAVRADGSQWTNLTNWDPDKTNGFTGVPFSPDGTTVAYARFIDGNIFTYQFGKWELFTAEFVVDENGVPSLQNTTNITPPNTAWVEPGDFSPDGKYLLITSDEGLQDAQGMDQFLLDMQTGERINLTNSPTVWDEHGVFSPNGQKILFMSSYPYRDDPNSHKVLSLKTEFMLMNADGSGLQQVTNFRTPGHAESSNDGIAAVGAWSPDGSILSVWQLLAGHQNVSWRIELRGNCGGDGAMKR